MRVADPLADVNGLRRPAGAAAPISPTACVLPNRWDELCRLAATFPRW